MSNKLIGTGPNQVPSNADLGTMAYQDSKSLNVSDVKSETLEIKPEVNKQGYALVVKTNHANNPIAMTISDSSLLNGIAFSQQAFTPLCVGRDSGSTFSAYFNGRVAIAAGYGINFGATSSNPSGYTINNNTMEDYEEGTFTPNAYGDSSPGTATYTYRDAWYRKVGDLVTVFVNMAYTRSGGSGKLRIGGLPFACNGESIGSVQANKMDGWQTNVGQYNPIIQDNDTSIHFRGTRNDGVQGPQYLQFQPMEYVRVNITYRAA